MDMGKETLEIKNFTSDELKLLLKDDDSFQQGIRLFACYQVATGIDPEDVAVFYGTSCRSIRNWVNRLNEGGIEALVDQNKQSSTIARMFSFLKLN
jgi:hypothetical protein